MKVLILGAKGMLGTDMQEAFTGYEVFPADADSVDITNRDAVIAKVEDVKPDIVVNCAAYTAVDKSETDEEEATRVNGQGTANVVAGCRLANATLVHISTDYVFDGKNDAGYKEDAKRNPINAYGRSKAAGELAVEGYEKLFLVRSSWTFGKRGNNFVETIRKLATDKKEITVVNDQFGSPTYTKDLAHAVARLVGQPFFGTYHITNEGTCSWYEFAAEIVKIAKLDCNVMPISTKDYGNPTPRPRTSILLNTKLPPLRPWRMALRAYLTEP